MNDFIDRTDGKHTAILDYAVFVKNSLATNRGKVITIQMQSLIAIAYGLISIFITAVSQNLGIALFFVSAQVAFLLDVIKIRRYIEANYKREVNLRRMRFNAGIPW